MSGRGAPPDGRWIAVLWIAATGPVLVAGFHLLATFFEIPAAKAPPGTSLAHLRNLGLVADAGAPTLAFVALCVLVAAAAMLAIPFARRDRVRTLRLAGLELLAVPVLLLASAAERWRAVELIVGHYGRSVWVLWLDGIPALVAVVCGVFGAGLVVRSRRGA